MPISESIKAMKPKVFGTSTEIKQISGHYYLYEVTSVWDAQKEKQAAEEI